MKKRLAKALPLLLAGTLELMPLAKSMLPTVTQGLVPSGGAIIFRWAAGALAMLGYHAISSASSIAISPANATVGQPYIGTVTYSGGHAGSVNSISFNSLCLAAAPIPFAPGLTITYNGGNTALVTGTPIGATNYAFTLRIFDGSTCGGGNSDTRSTTLVVGAGGGGRGRPGFHGGAAEYHRAGGITGPLKRRRFRKSSSGLFLEHRPECNSPCDELLPEFVQYSAHQLRTLYRACHQHLGHNPDQLRFECLHYARRRSVCPELYQLRAGE